MKTAHKPVVDNLFGSALFYYLYLLFFSGGGGVGGYWSQPKICNNYALKSNAKVDYSTGNNIFRALSTFKWRFKNS